MRDLDLTNISDSQRNIVENGIHFLEKLDNFSEDELLRLAQFIINRCFMVAVSTPDLESAYRIFSVLNDRGLDLSLTDILKAETIGKIVQDKQDSYTEKWENLEEDLGRDTFRDLFAHIRMIYRKTKPRDSLLKEFRQYVDPAKDPEKFIDDILIPYADAFDLIKSALYQSHKYSDDMNSLFLTNTPQLCCGDERITVLTIIAYICIDDRITQRMSLCL